MTTHFRLGLAQALGDTTVTNYGIPSVEAWRPYVENQAGDLPIDFLMAWIAKESGGWPCDFTYLFESGIFQLERGDNINTAGTTEALQHPVPPCTANCIQYAGQKAPSCMFLPMTALSEDQKNEQVRAGIQYVNAGRAYAHARLAEVNTDWDETSPSFWQLTKMYHVAPGWIGPALQAATDELGSPPPDWNTLRPYFPQNHQDWLDNAEGVGSYGDGGGRSTAGIIIDQVVNTFSPTTPRGLIFFAGLVGVGLGAWAFHKHIPGRWFGKGV